MTLFAVAEQQQCKNPFDSLTNPTGNNEPRTPEAFCALTGTNFGANFYCSSLQSNLQLGLPNGWTGYCMAAGENLGNTGYSATTFSGGADLVHSFSTAQNTCNLLGSQCGSIVRCTRP
jgi:hypothetical protein